MPFDWSILIPYIILAGGGLFILCSGMFSRKMSLFFFGVALAAVVAAGIAAISYTPAALNFDGMVDGHGYARYFVFIICIIALITLFLSYLNARLKDSGDEYYSLVLFAALGMALAASAVNWIVFFLGLEMLSISLYVLICSVRTDPKSNEAALKYFVMGSVASGFLVFGMSLVFAASGTLDIARSLGAAVSGENTAAALLGMGLIAAGIFFKVSIVPFHLWTPDVYQGAPAPVTAFLSTGSKVALFGALLRFSLAMTGDLFTYAVPVLWAIAAATMIVGNITALVQTHLKRLLAYSSIAQMGYVLTALITVKQGGAPAVMFYLAAYAIMDLGAFGTVALLSPEKSELDSIEEYRGLGYSHPWTGALLTVCLLSLAGLPPTIGFFGKIFIFKSVLQAGFPVLAVLGIITAIISVFFYLNVIVTLYMRAETAPAETARPGIFGAVVSGCILAIVIVLGIIPSSLFSLIEEILYTFNI